MNVLIFIAPWFLALMIVRQLCVWEAFTSADSTNHRSKTIFKGMLLLPCYAYDGYVCTEHVQTFLLSLSPKQYSITTIYIALYYNPPDYRKK